jgi:hypothetical protein
LRLNNPKGNLPMKTVLFSLAVVLLSTLPCQAIKITAFTNTDTFIERAKDIVIAKCLGSVVDANKFEDGLYPVDVQIVVALKGSKDAIMKPGKAKIATIYPMEVGKTYLLTSMGGSAFGTEFLAVPELSVVELPQNFRLEELKNKTVKEQVQMVFAARRKENEWQQQHLNAEKKLLDKGLSSAASESGPKSEITSEMRVALERINTIKKGSEQQVIDEAVDALNKEIARLDPKVFVPLAAPHLLRLAPKDSRTRALLRQALEKGWIEEQLTRAFLIQAGDNPEPHIKQLVKDLESVDAKVRSRAINAIGGCGAAASPALPKLREIVKKAKADPNDFSRAFTCLDEVPEHIRAFWAITIIEAVKQ